MSVLPLIPVTLAAFTAGGIVFGPLGRRRGYRAAQRDATDVARVLRGVTDEHTIHAGAFERRRYRGIHRSTWRRKLADWWKQGEPRDIDAPVRAALNPSPSSRPAPWMIGQPGMRLVVR